MYRILITLIILPLAVQLGFANGPDFKDNWYKNWRMGAIGGVSYHAFELKKDFTRATMDMNSVPDLAYSFFANKRINKQLELGLEYEKDYFNGFQKNPSNVNWLMYDKAFNSGTAGFLPHPIYYSTNISSWYINGYYSFLNMYSIYNNLLNINMYIKGGIGVSALAVELGYKNAVDYELTQLPNPLFEKGQGRHKSLDSYGTFHLGTGLNYYFSNRISFSVEAMFLFVSADYLDGVHNFDAIKTNENKIQLQRVGVLGTVGQIKVGFSYHFNLYNNKEKNSRYPYYIKNDRFKNDFYYNKKYNRFILTPYPFKIDKDKHKPKIKID